jgi:hypothetical protein
MRVDEVDKMVTSLKVDKSQDVLQVDEVRETLLSVLSFVSFS